MAAAQPAQERPPAHDRSNRFTVTPGGLGHITRPEAAVTRRRRRIADEE
jgi:hypothetical protein